MTTLKRIEANRRNSRKSTGPKTRTGKTESKTNAMKHGLLAADLVVRDEDPVEFAGVHVATPPALSCRNWDLQF